ncbi:MAG: hypothetical protein M1457_00190 [bacterium]|nr:hypothetical protein [bacterium]
MQAAIRGALGKAAGGLRLTDFRDRVLENELFKGHDKLGLYSQIAAALKVMPDVVKAADKSYTLASMAGNTKTPATKATKVARRKPAKPSMVEAEAGKDQS